MTIKTTPKKKTTKHYTETLFGQIMEPKIKAKNGMRWLKAVKGHPMEQQDREKLRRLQLQGIDFIAEPCNKKARLDWEAQGKTMHDLSFEVKGAVHSRHYSEMSVHLEYHQENTFTGESQKSGISTCRAKYFCFFTHDNIFIMETEALRQWLKDNINTVKKSQTTWETNYANFLEEGRKFNKSYTYLIPREIMLLLSVRILNVAEELEHLSLTTGKNELKKFWDKIKKEEAEKCYRATYDPAMDSLGDRWIKSYLKADHRNGMQVDNSESPF